MSEIGGRGASRKRVASRLGLHPRALDRPELSIEEISEFVGYSEKSAFERTFRRWSGQSPAAYRRALAAQQAGAAEH